MYLKRLAELRNKFNLKQGDVAKIIGVARSTYNMYETGNRRMDYEMLIKLANHYKVSLDYIFERTDNPLHPESHTQDEIEFMNRTVNLYIEIKNKYK